ncbi:ABC transporter substrate-binding protein [Clostridium sp. DJ247]|uniref:ABC transporter substrate-binding protein n=1 Tax=Clostridium sp. DJ247 TaxID=2726188 RepID=UPI0016277556|nr:ABC transporter substrate-binding protein [Clostridium sp. DJ247]MBC2579757.1 ABC transporter substrate-binding protein [Clostridium sp. DJ247]
MKKMPKIMSLLLGATLTGTLLLSGCGAKDKGSVSEQNTQNKSNQVETKKITLWGVIDPQISAQQVIAEKKGYFKEEGIDVENKFVQSGPEIGPMIAGGSAPLSFETNYTVTSSVASNIPVKLVAPVANIGGTQALVIRKDLVINSAKDLEGKKIGMAPGSGVYIAIKKMCDELGVDISKIKFVYLQPADQIAALDKKDIDAMACWEPWVTKASAVGGKILFSGKKSYLPEKKGDVDWLNFISTFQVSEDFLKKNPNTVKAVLRALDKATVFINEHRDESIDILSKEFKIDKNDLKKMMDENIYTMQVDNTIYNGVNEMSSFMLEQKNIRKKPEFKDLTDFSLLKEVSPDKVKLDSIK